jgi:hypothetical protein
MDYGIQKSSTWSVRDGIIEILGNYQFTKSTFNVSYQIIIVKY